MHSTLVIGGAASGKSEFAENYVLKKANQPVYLATMAADLRGDSEIEDRIKTHRKRRDDRWLLIEEQNDIGCVLAKYTSDGYCVLVECLTLWLSNISNLSDGDIEARLTALIEVINSDSAGVAVFVSNEIGCGTVPFDKDTRRFRHMHGLINSRIAQASAEVYLVVAGLAQQLKQ